MKTNERGMISGRGFGSGRRGWTRRMMQGAVLVAVAASLSAVGGAWGAGEGKIQINNVAAGTAAMSQQGAVTTIRTGGQNTIINFQRLGVGAGETLRFAQPNATSRVLNRIQGSDPTRIDGTITSNGRVYLVNPAGVMFGNGAVVNAAGFYAAAGNLSDQNFMAGVNAFTNNAGTVRNEGIIKADQVHLVGLNVENFGQIVAGGAGAGVVTLTAGKDVYIGETTSPTGAPSVLVKVSTDGGAHAGTGVSNSGKIDAGGGSLRMGAGDVYAAGIYNSGTLKGRAISLNSGASTNINAGNIDASSASGKGGTVELLGDKVGVDGTVDASGATGGGTIMVGGDYHGGGTTPTASRTYVGPSGVLKADATVSGNGGKVVVWAYDITRF